MSWIKWCKCQRYILTTEQMTKNLPCAQCQKEAKEKEIKQHTENYHEKFDIDK